MTKVMTQSEFEALSPYHRGYAVYMLGEREDQPNVPNESNPYLDGTQAASEWDNGQFRAYIHVLDVVE